MQFGIKKSDFILQCQLLLLIIYNWLICISHYTVQISPPHILNAKSYISLSTWLFSTHWFVKKKDKFYSIFYKSFQWMTVLVSNMPILSFSNILKLSLSAFPAPSILNLFL
jgi:hypothetical protein